MSDAGPRQAGGGVPDEQARGGGVGAGTPGAGKRGGSGGSGGRGDWSDKRIWEIQPIRDLMLLAAVLGIVWIGYRLSVVTVPLLLALTLAYLVEPVVAWVCRRTAFGRPAVAVAFILLAGLVVVGPLTAAVSIGVAQGAGAAAALARHSGDLLTSVQSDDPKERQQAYAALPGTPERGWKQISLWLQSQQAQLEQYRRQRAMERTGAAPADGPADGEAQPGGDGQQGPAEAALPASGLPAPAAADAAAEAASVMAEGEAVPGDGAVTAARTMPSWQASMYDGIALALTFVRENAQAIGRAAGQRVIGTGAQAVQAVLGVFVSIGTLAFGAFLTAVFFYFASTGFGKVRSGWRSVVPEDRLPRVEHLVGRMDRAIAAFVRGRVTICLVMMVMYSLGYWILGVPAPLLAGLLVGLLTIVPYAAGLASPIIMLLLWLSPGEGIRGEWWWAVGGPLVMLGITQAVDDWVLTPLVQGKATQMEVPLILFASIAGGVLGGFYGLLLAIPAAACIKILVEEVVWPRVRAWAEGRVKDPLPIGDGS